MFDFLKNPEVQGALLAAALAIITAVSGLVLAFINRFTKRLESQDKKDLADSAAAHGVSVTEGVSADYPIPLDRLPEVVANAKAYAVEMNPGLTAKMNGFGDRILTRLTVEDAPAATVKATAAAGDIQTPDP